MSQQAVAEHHDDPGRGDVPSSALRSRWWEGMRAHEILVKWAVILTLSIGVAIVLVPFLWMLSVSLKDDAQVYRAPPVWIPNPLEWSNYVDVVTTIPFFTLLRNTLMMTAGRVIGTLVSASLVAYGFSRFRARGRDLLFHIVLATMILPYQVTLIPQFILFSKLGWVNSFKPLIVPYWFGGSAFDIFLLRQFFMTLPLEYDDSARIDGANRLQILVKIILPLSAPALATVAIFSIRYSWNDFIGPLVYLRSMAESTIALGVFFFKDMYQPRWNRLMAMAVLAMVPLITLFFFAQRLFIQGVVISGVKG